MIGIYAALRKYDLVNYYETWIENSIFPSYSRWKGILKQKIRESENSYWIQYCNLHPNMELVKTCLDNVTPFQFWSISKDFPDLVKHLHQQVRLWGSFGLNAGVPWLLNIEDTICFICKGVENINHFLFECSNFKGNFDSLG